MADTLKPADIERLIATDDDLLTHEFPGYSRGQLRTIKKEAKMARKKLSQELELDRKAMESRRLAKFSEEKYKQLLEENGRLQQEQNAILQIRKTPQEFTIRPKDRSHSEATAFMVASDWHIEELVRAETVSGLNSYTLDIAKERAIHFFQNGMKLVQMCGRDVTIKTVVIPLLGDFISGTIHEELAENNQLMPADAAWTVQGWIISGINFILNNSNYEVIVPCSSGNHGRMTKKIHHSTEQGNSLENYMYHNLSLHFRDNKRVKFLIAEGYHIYMDVYGLQIRLHHGHSIKYGGGVGGIYIPVNKSIAQWNKGRRADLDVFGHFHQQRDGGNFLCNGSLIGYNSFALSIKADYEKPRQSFFLVDRDRGKTIVAPIIV
jgi:hypothetical protein